MTAQRRPSCGRPARSRPRRRSDRNSRATGSISRRARSSRSGGSSAALRPSPVTGGGLARCIGAAARFCVPVLGTGVGRCGGSVVADCLGTTGVVVPGDRCIAGREPVPSVVAAGTGATARVSRRAAATGVGGGIAGRAATSTARGNGDPPTGRAAAVGTLAVRAPVVGTPAGRAPVVGTSAGRAPIVGIPAGRARLDSAPVMGTPVGPEPVGGASVGRVPAGGTLVGRVPVGRTSVGDCWLAADRGAGSPPASVLGGVSVCWVCFRVVRRDCVRVVVGRVQIARAGAGCREMVRVGRAPSRGGLGRTVTGSSADAESGVDGCAGHRGRATGRRAVAGDVTAVNPSGRPVSTCRGRCVIRGLVRVGVIRGSPTIATRGTGAGFLSRWTGWTTPCRAGWIPARGSDCGWSGPGTTAVTGRDGIGAPMPVRRRRCATGSPTASPATTL